ncbi:xanthine dehydrogenase family protein subunit M [Vineibacter terrae]|uniref:Xanthine dehydrogenase family protein subunit M n=1 Tax=Vineibacter terrae TaxID=2586908 RepID=A0A5C8PBA5_9HYPH|nr:FAD binding domain-containing protein [Vineibacter terrae]TXL70975.1 xanthine dehydrogenase family protein subunit M [Vineibacter terrae]
MGLYLRPQTVEEAVAALAAHAPAVLAGGTDFYPARVGRAPDDDVLDITAIDGLRGIDDDGDYWRIGAATTWRDIIDAPLPPLLDGLKLAAREIGGAQIQNAGTVAGNLCNASPAADGVPALLALDAQVILQSATAARVLPLAKFIIGNRRTALRTGEIMTAILVPKRSSRAVGDFLKLGARRYLVISIAMVAGVMDVDDDGRITSAAIAVGACAEVARRLPALEQALLGRRADGALQDIVAEPQFAPLQPIDDVRGSAAYRLAAAATLTRRLLVTLSRKAAGPHA